MADSAKVIRLEPEVQRHVRARMTRLPALVLRLHDKGKSLLQDCLEVYFDSADDELFCLADKASSNEEQSSYFEAMRELRVQRKGIEKRFLEQVEEAFARLVDADVRDSLGADAELSADALSLVRNDELEQMAALEDTINRANGKFFVAQQAFCSKLGPFVPQKLDESNNPFGPSVVCHAYMAQIKRLDIDVQAKLVLFELFDRVVVDATQSISQRLLAILGQQGSASEVKAEAEAGVQTESSSEKDANPAEQARQQLKEQRKQLIQLLSFVQKLPIASSAKGLDIELLLESVQARRGLKLNLSSVERETIKLVQLLFDFFIRDATLACSVKEQLMRLQVPLLKVALIEESFLHDKQHPARALVNEIASLGLGLRSDQGLSGKESGPIRTIKVTIDRIVNEFGVDTQIYSLALTDFTTYVAKEQRRSMILEKRTIDAEDGKAKVEEARLAVSSELELRTMAYQVPQAIDELVFKAWRSVLFVAALKKGVGSPEWELYTKALSDLLWSVQPSQNKIDRQRLIKMVPDLIGRLRKGLDSVSHNPFEAAELFQKLEQVHIARIRGEALADEQDQTEQSLDEFSQLDHMAEPEPVAEVEVQAPQVEDAYIQRASNFSPGAWFDIRLEAEEPVRCRLAAIIKATGKYIFVNRSGVKVAEKTLEEVALDLREQNIKAIDDSQLFDRALESIVTGLRKPAGDADKL